MRVAMLLRAAPLALLVPSAAFAAAPLFVQGSIVVAVSGGDGVSDNQASALRLVQFSTSGAHVGTDINVSTQASTPFSVEYGSSSEGMLQRSADGKSLTIMGYGVDATAFNANPGSYGSNDSSKPGALAQSTSIQNNAGGYTAVARVVANITATDIDTSTALYGVFDQNNPRSAYTMNGQTFYVSGQGVSGDTTGGVFYANKGASSATAITGKDTGVQNSDGTTTKNVAGQDTRDVQIYNGQLYSSQDSKQGQGNNRDFIGTLGTGTPTTTVGGSKPTGPTALPGYGNNGGTGKQVLTATTANGISLTGQEINLSPEQFFFADPNTLYVADSGNPKNDSVTNDAASQPVSSLGDGGLQKWTYNATTGKWVLQYTLSTGLNLVANTSASGVTGLFGLAGQVNLDGTVSLYATTSVIGDTDTTYLYSITDLMSSTTGAGESFTKLATADAGTKFMGVALAPVPEPASWAMMVGGFGLIGATLRRRKTSVRFA